MKKMTVCITAALLAFFCYALKDSHSVKGIGRDAILQSFRKNVAAFTADLAALQQVINNISTDTATISAAKNQLKACRLSYKKIEFFTEYFFSTRIKIFNAAPVYEIEEPYMEYQHPTGMQSMEAILFGDAPAAEKNELAAQAELMHTTAAGLTGLLYSTDVNDTEIITAIRIETIRICALGLTGYDAPEFKTAVPEACVSIQSLQESLLPYLTACDPNLAGSIKADLELCMKRLHAGKSFNSFDRLHFLTESFLPLQEKIGSMARSLGLRKENEMLNFDAQNIFSRDAIKKTAQPDSLASPELIMLGKKLFYEKRLSGNNLRSCASCHKPDKYFSDGEITAMAFDGKSRLLRNAPSLTYAAYQHEQFLDGRAKDLPSQMIEVLTSPIEMNANPVVIVKRLMKDTAYRKLFAKAFPQAASDSIISIQKISRAITGYEQSFLVLTSPFDKYMAGNEGMLTKAQQHGFNLFMGKAMCGSCHFAPLFNGLLPPEYTITEVESLGLTKNTNFKKPIADADSGRYKYFNIPFYIGAFKTPTVRNVAMTAPYMHNGAFAKLNDVLEFYNNGGGNGMGLRNKYQTLSDKRLHLTKKEMTDIISFLNSLTDEKQK